MNYSYDLQYIKENLDISQIEEVLIEFGGEPTQKGDILISRTICHNHPGEGTAKLYYYDNSHLFHCFTDCGESFDVFELTRKFMSREHPKPRKDGTWNLPEAVEYIARKFGYAPNIEEEENDLSIQRDLTIIQNYDRIKEINVNTQQIELKEYDGSFLNNLPFVNILPWEKENISRQVMWNAGIRFDPLNQGIVIPHRDINGRLVGIRERTLIEEQAERYGKYMPAKIGGIMYNHPLSYNLYNLNHSKDQIQMMQKAIIFEGEKSCLKYRSFFGEENDISVATCGQSLLKFQLELLYNVGAKEIIIAWDREGEKDNKEKYVQKFYSLQKKYGNIYYLSFIYDKEGKYLDYKMSPIDAGKDIFLKLYKERITLY